MHIRLRCLQDLEVFLTSHPPSILANTATAAQNTTSNITMHTRNQFLSGLVPLTKLAEGIEDECSVCTEEFIGPVELPCKHIFCKTCITEWVSRRNKNTCPMCRAALFPLEEVARGPAGTNRLEVIAQAMSWSRLMTADGFDIYDDEIFFTRAAVQRAAASASQYLILEDHPAQTEILLIDVGTLGPHLIAMANLLARGYARAMGRPYSGYQRRDWKLIVSRLYTLLEAVDGQVRYNNHLVRIIPDFRARIRESLRQELIDTESGHFFDRDARMESPSGDLDALLNYVVFQCAKAYRDRETRRATLRHARWEALDAETSTAGRTMRWVRQNVFRGI